MNSRRVRVGSVAGALVLLAHGLALMPANAAPDEALAWTQNSSDITAMEGTSATQSLDLTFTSDVNNPGVQIDGNLKDVATVDMSHVEVTSEGHASVNLTINLPAKASSSYVGNIKLTNQGQPLDRPLHVSVQTTYANATTIPDSVEAPSADRIGKYLGMPVTVDILDVRLNPGGADPAGLIQQIAAKNGAQIVGSIADAGYYELRVPGATPTSLNPIRDAIAATPGVAEVGHDGLSSSASITNDPKVWPSGSTTQTDNNWNLQQIDAPSAWDESTGKNVVVGILDSDFYAGHADLNPNIARASTYTADPEHGTHVAGTACAAGNNGIGIVGVAYNCSLNLQGLGHFENVTLGELISGMKAIANSAKTPRVVNVSMQYVTGSDCLTNIYALEELQDIQAARNAMSQAIQTARGLQSPLWVFAAGNVPYNSSCSAYGDLGNLPELPNVVTVASSTISAGQASYSIHGPGVTVAAPGGEADNGVAVHGILSTIPGTCQWWKFSCSKDQYEYMSGTSQAAPHVTGAAALAFSVKQSMTAADVKKCLIDGASAGGKQISGQPYSIINAKDTVDCALGTLSTSASTTPVRVGQVGTAVLAPDGGKVASIDWVSTPIPGAVLSPGFPTIPATITWTPQVTGTASYTVRIASTTGAVSDVSGAFDAFPVPPQSLAVTNLQTQYDPTTAAYGYPASIVSFNVVKTSPSDTSPGKSLNSKENVAIDFFSYVSGDSNDDGVLDPGETWSYSGHAIWGDWEPGNTRTRTVIVKANDTTGAGAWVELESAMTLTR